VTIKDIITYNGFGFKEWGILTERVVTHHIILSLFPQVCIMTSMSQVTYAKMDSILACQVSCVPI